MQYQIAERSGAVEVALKGRLEFGDHSSFRELAAKVTELPPKEIVLDLSAVEFVDSSGLGLFIVLRNLAERRNVALVLKKAKGPVRELLTVTRFEMLARIED